MKKFINTRVVHAKTEEEAITKIENGDFDENDVFSDKVLPMEELKTELRVYVVEADNKKYEPTMNDEEFIGLSEEEGRIYTVDGFQEAFNLEDVNSRIDIVRFINVPKFD